MNDPTTPVLKDLVLIGGGHSHVIVLKRLGMAPVPGLRVTMIARDIHTPYSGMLPGLIAGHYRFDDVHIDLAPLCQFSGARLYHDEAVGLDLAARLVHCHHRPPVPFDLLSIDIGVTPLLAVAGAAEHAVPVKPITTLVSRWERLRERVRQSTRATHVGIVGAGAAGVELALAIQYALRRLLAEEGRSHAEPEIHLFSATSQILPTHNRRARRKFGRVLQERGIQVHRPARVTKVESGSVEVEDGTQYQVDEVVWATEAGAQAWPARAGLDVDDDGFIRVDDTLQSTSHPGVFAAGDIAAMVNHPRQKAGVFAVRQGRPLETNLRRAARGQPLKPFTPQRHFLSLISTGDRYAVASRGGWSLEGRWVWAWKDWLDGRFMLRFRDLPEMDESQSSNGDLERLASPEVVRQLSTAAMRCGGCGSKVGATVLDRVLTRLTPFHREEVTVGLHALDDASVEHVPAGASIVHTVDAFRAIIDDPYVFGKITATHCLGDVYAMGAEPRTALAIVTLPLAPESKMETLLHELLAGAVEILNEAETTLVGGHTTEGRELVLGFALSGVVDAAQVMRKSGMRPGHRLILTKPLGTGTIFAAHMRLKARGRWVAGAVASMVQSNRAAAACLRRYGASACTDVTGFGLIGHLVEMARASGVDVRLRLASVPLLDGACDTIADGFLSSLHPQNVRLRRAVANIEEVASAPGYPAVYDPQTAGGLLASVPSDVTETCLAELRELGYAGAAVIGTVEPSSERDAPIWIER